MQEIIVYEMALKMPSDYADYTNTLDCIPFQEKYWDEYKRIYNACFYEMRNSLEIEPKNFYSDYSQMRAKADDTFLCLQNGSLLGAVSCYGNEIDDLIVAEPFQRRGVGEKLLLWGIRRIQEQGYKEAVLHVAEWNRGAMRLYLKNGFEIRKKERVR